MKRANIITSIIMLILAGYIFNSSYQMQYMTESGVPGPGFMPLWISVFITLVAVLLLFMNTVRNKPDSDRSPEFNTKFWVNTIKVIGVSAVCMLLVKVLGMLVAIGLMTGILSWLFGKKDLKTNIFLTVLTPVVFYFIFSIGLQVMFPTNVFGF